MATTAPTPSLLSPDSRASAAPHGDTAPPRLGHGEQVARERRRIDPGVAALVLFALVWPLWASNSWLFIVQMSFLTGLVAVGTMAVVGWARETTLMQAGLTGTALYIAGWAYRDNTGGLGLPFPLAVGLAVAVVVGISVLVALVAYRLSPIYIMVLTLTVQFTIANTVFTWTSMTGGLAAPTVERPKFFGLDMRSEVNFYYFLLGITLVLIYLTYRFKMSRFGRAMMMVGNDPESAAAVGVNPWGYKVGAFAIAGLFAGIGGALWAPQLGSPPGPVQFLAMNSLVYLAVPVLAGFGSITGVVAIGMAFMALPMAATQYGFTIQPLLLGGVALLIGTLMGPRGVSGAFADLRDWTVRTLRTDGVPGLVRSLPSPRWSRLRKLSPARIRQGIDERRTYGELRAADDGGPW